MNKNQERLQSKVLQQILKIINHYCPEKHINALRDYLPSRRHRRRGSAAELPRFRSTTAGRAFGRFFSPLHYDQNDTVNDTVKSKHDTVNDTVLNLIKQNNVITAVEIGDLLKISLSTAKRRIKVLKNLGRIARKGSDKSGYWEILGENN